MSMANVQTVAL